ncbi:MAG: NnrS family protein [Proteobacteria bacterium]|nr:NnrS family protein [Pseudomonadota bacterium]
MTTTAERYRAYEGAALFSMGFRPFFFAAGIWAALAVPLWIAAYGGWLTQVNRDWHVHEMLFGYLSAVIAGFLLTAVPNWTGRLPVTGRPLMALFSLWLAGRIVMLAAPASVLAAVVDSAFLVALSSVVAREVIAGRNLRNLPVSAMVALLALANVLTHFRGFNADLASFGERGALGVIAMLLALIGGRIVPSFTRNWMAKRQFAKLPAPAGRFDVIVLAVCAIALASWVAAPAFAGAGLLLMCAGVLTGFRLLRWRGWTTSQEPLVLILHVGYAWLAAALLLIGAHILAPEFIASAVGIHALTAGAFGVMTLAVMTRATRGHTGQFLTADGPTRAIYLLVNLGAALRVIAPFLPGFYLPLLIAAAVAWSGGFAVFAAAYAPLLLRPRASA